MGRPTKYTDELAAEICAAIATSNKGLQHLCDEHENWPVPSTIYLWLIKHKDFSEKYARAKEDQTQVVEDEMLAIADDARNDFIEIQRKRGSQILFDKENVMRSNLRIETRKWLLGKLKPKKYGDKLAVEHDVSDSLAERIAKARQNVTT